jgi:hypothetical protein
MMNKKTDKLSKVMIRSMRIVFLAGLFGWGISAGLQAQEANTLYFMKLPQANLMNPASQQYCNFYLNLPLLGATSANVMSSSVSFQDLVFPGTGEYADSLITILHPSYDIDDFLDKLYKKNYIAPTLTTNVLTFGFRVKRLYFHIGVTENANIYLGYPKDMMTLLFKGNAAFAGATADFSSLSMDATLYSSYALGVSARVTDHLSLGIRGKFLSGVTNGSLENRGTHLTIDDEDYSHTLDADLSLNLSAPVEVVTDSAGYVSDIVLNDDYDTPENVLYYLIHPDNPGFAFDVGAEYRFNERVMLSASVLDLGMIRWKRDVSSLVSRGQFVFSGLDASPLFDVYDTTTLEDVADQLLDSLKAVFEPTVEHHAYTTTLAPKLYVGGTFHLTPSINIGLLSRSEFRQKNIIQSFTFSANTSVKRWLNFTFSYTYSNHSYNNIGAGLSLRGGPIQFYFMTDYALGYLYPDASRALGGWFGLNLIFGCRERVMDDLPLIR